MNTLPVKTNDNVILMQADLGGGAAFIDIIDHHPFGTIFHLTVAKRGTLQSRDNQLSAGGGGGALIQRHFDIDRFSVAQQAQFDFGPRLGGGDPRAQFGKTVQRFAVQANDDVAGFDPRFGGSGVWQHFTDEGAALNVEVHRLGDIGAHFHAFNAQQAALDFAKLNELVGEGFRHVARDGEADADAAAARRQDRGVDPDKLAVEVQQRAAGVAAVDGGIGLDEILQPFKVQAAAAKGRDNAGCGGLAKAERVADGDGEVADAQFIGVSNGDLRQV